MGRSEAEPFSPLLGDVMPCSQIVMLTLFLKYLISTIDIPLDWKVYNVSREVIVMELKIGELAKRIGVNPKTIRFYEKIGLITANRAPNGYRLYNSQDESNLLFIKRAQKLGLSLQEIGLIIQDIQQGQCKTAKSQIRDMLLAKIPEIDHQIKELQALKTYLIERLNRIEIVNDVSPSDKGCSCLND